MWSDWLPPGVIAAGVACAGLAGVWWLQPNVRLLPALAGAALGSFINGSAIGWLITLVDSTYLIPSGVILGLMGAVAASFGYIGICQAVAPVARRQVFVGLLLATLIGGGPLILGLFAVWAYVICQYLMEERKRRGSDSPPAPPSPTSPPPETYKASDPGQYQ